jgi:hypothetical protein
VFTSPSVAAKPVAGHAMNGWWSWRAERRPGEWVMLKEFRRSPR